MVLTQILSMKSDIKTGLKRDKKFTDKPVRKQEVATKNRDSILLNSINFETTVTSSSGVFPTNAAFDKRPAKGKAKSIEKDLTLISNVLLKMNKSLQWQQDVIDKQPDVSSGSTLLRRQRLNYQSGSKRRWKALKKAGRTTPTPLRSKARPPALRCTPFPHSRSPPTRQTPPVC